MEKRVVYAIIIALVLYGVFNPPERIPGDILDTKLNELSVYGELTGIEHEDEITRIEIAQEMYNCKRNSSTVVIYGKIPPFTDLQTGNKYMIVFTRVNKNYEWQGGIDSSGLGYCNK